MSAPARTGARVIGVAVAAVVGAAMTAAAQGAAGSRGGVFLTLPASPRASAMADASAAAAADAWALFTAPAQLARIGTFQAALASEAYLASTQLSALAVAVPAFGGTLGVGVTMLDYGSVNEIASSVPGGEGLETGRTWSAMDNAVIIGMGRAFGSTRAFRVGVTVAVVNVQVADLSASSTAGSFGAAWSAASGWHLNGTVQHIGPALELGATTGALPVTARLAVAAPATTWGGFGIRPVAEWRAVRGAGNEAAAGAEAAWRNRAGHSLAFRAGYTARSAPGDRWPVSFGVGAGLGPVELDYATQRFTTIDQVTHRLGVRYARRATR